MKEIRPEFSDEEYTKLKMEAERLHLSVKELIHDRALNFAPEDKPLSAAKVLADEVSAVRAQLNQIIRRETTAQIRLWEDDMIRMEMSMAKLERIVAAFISDMMQEVKRNGNFTV